MGIKASGNKNRAYLAGVTRFAMRDIVRWVTGSWVLTLGVEVGAVCVKLSPRGNKDTLGGDAGVTLGEGAGFTKMCFDEV